MTAIRLDDSLGDCVWISGTADLFSVGARSIYRFWLRRQMSWRPDRSAAYYPAWPRVEERALAAR